MNFWFRLHPSAKGYVNLALYLAASYLFLRFLLPYLMPFILAAFLAIMIDPVVNRLEGLRIPRSVASGFMVALGVALTFLFSLYLLARLGSELASLAVSLPDVYRNFMALVDFISERVGAAIATLPPGVKVTVEKQISLLFQGAQGLVTGVLGMFQAWLQVLPNAGAVFLLTALATYFISSEKALVRRFLLALIPVEWQPGVISVKAKLVQSTVGLIKAQAVMVFITFLIILAGLLFLGTNYSLTIAILSAILDILPVLGPALIFLPWSIFALITGKGFLGVWLLVLYGAVAIVRGIIQPRIIGERIGLHPLATLVALYIGVKVFGAAGFIYGPLVVIVLKAAVGGGLFSIGSLGRIIRP